MKLSHPFISELKRFVANQNSTLGPIVMHLCELIQFKIEPSKQDDIRGKQRKLSQVTDMIHAAHIFHRCVNDNQQQVAPTNQETNTTSAKRLHQDNVLSLLVGDYLLAQSSVDMADLKYPITVGLIAKGLEDYTRGEFLKLKLVENFEKKLLNSKEICQQIGRYAQLTCGSLLSNASLSAALLAGHPKLSSGFSSPTDRESDTIYKTMDVENTNNLSNLVYSFGFHTGSAHRLIEILYCPDTNSEDDRKFIKSLDVELLNESLRSHLNKSISLLNKLPDGEKRPTLLAMLADMMERCH